jgi:hypothetical protein
LPTGASQGDTAAQARVLEAPAFVAGYAVVEQKKAIKLRHNRVRFS